MTAADFDRAADRHPTVFLVPLATWQQLLGDHEPTPTDQDWLITVPIQDTPVAEQEA